MDEVKLEKNGLILRLLKLPDADRIFHLVDSNRQHFRQWLPWVDETKTVNDSRKYIQDATEQHEKGTGLYLGIEHKGELIGTVAFIFIHKRNRKAHIGYWLDQGHQGKGIMTTACRMLISYGFRKLNLNRVELGCAVDNARSCAIPKRLGFTKEGVIRDSEWLYDHFVDHEFYGLLLRNWDSSRE